MLDVPIESTYIWLGLAVVSAAILGLAIRVPTAPPPDATPAAQTVDSVASSPYEARGAHPLGAEEIRLGSDRIGLRTNGGEAYQTFSYGPVAPTFGHEALTAVLRGRHPSDAFITKVAFERALDRARTNDPAWQPAPETLVVRRVNWGDLNATLVGA